MIIGKRYIRVSGKDVAPGTPIALSESEEKRLVDKGVATYITDETVGPVKEAVAEEPAKEENALEEDALGEETAIPEFNPEEMVVGKGGRKGGR